MSKWNVVSGRGLRKAALPVVAAIMVVGTIAAIVCASVYGSSWGERRYHDKPIAQARDGARDAAQQVMLNVLTVDRKDAAGWERRVKASLTGPALAAYDTQLKPTMEQLSSGQTEELKPTIASWALSSVDADDGSAKAMVYVNLVATAVNKQSATQVMGFVVDLSRTKAGWKAVNIQSIDSVPLPVTDGSTTPAPSTQAPAPTQGGG